MPGWKPLGARGEANTAPLGWQSLPRELGTAELLLQELSGHGREPSRLAGTRLAQPKALEMCHCQRRAARAGCPHLSQVSMASPARAGAETGAKQEPSPESSH